MSVSLQGAEQLGALDKFFPSVEGQLEATCTFWWSGKNLQTFCRFEVLFHSLNYPRIGRGLQWCRRAGRLARILLTMTLHVITTCWRGRRRCILSVASALDRSGSWPQPNARFLRAGTGEGRFGSQSLAALVLDRCRVQSPIAHDKKTRGMVRRCEWQEAANL